MSEDDPFNQLDADADFPTPPSHRPPPKGRAEVFPDDEEGADAPPRRAPLSRRTGTAAAPAAPESEDYGFGTQEAGDEAFGAAAEPRRARRDRPVEDRHEGHEEEADSDLYEEREGHEAHVHEEAVEEGEEAPEDEASGGKVLGVDRRKLPLYGGVLAAMLAIGFLGYKSVGSFFDLGQPQSVGALAPVGGFNGTRQASASPMPAGAPRLPPSRPALPEQRAGGSPSGVGMPSAMGTSYEAPNQRAQAAPSAPAPVGPATKAEPSGLDKEAVGRLSEAMARLEARVDALASKQDLEASVSSLQARLASVESRAVAPTTPRPGIEPPAKPVVIQGWSLKGVAGGPKRIAWLDGPDGTFREAKEGDDLPGAGKVKAISSYQGDWIVMTDRGVIVRK